MKKAYYLVARVHHPDKKGNTKEATAYFQEIQHAYEILSDKNERAWYDSHREEILRGGTGGGGDDGDSFADELDLNKFPTPGPFFTGTYKVFGDMFREIDSFEKKKAYDRAGEEKNTTQPHHLGMKTPMVTMYYHFINGGLDLQPKTDICVER